MSSRPPRQDRERTIPGLPFSLHCRRHREHTGRIQIVPYEILRTEQDARFGRWARARLISEQRLDVARDPRRRGPMRSTDRTSARRRGRRGRPWNRTADNQRELAHSVGWRGRASPPDDRPTCPRPCGEPCSGPTQRDPRARRATGRALHSNRRPAPAAPLRTPLGAGQLRSILLPRRVDALADRAPRICGDQSDLGGLEVGVNAERPVARGEPQASDPLARWHVPLS
jgi:hypothetical protein